MKHRSDYRDHLACSARLGSRLAPQASRRRRSSKPATCNSQLRIVQLLLIGVLAMGLVGADTDARFTKLGHELMCMCGCGQVLLECNHVGCTYSDRMRDELAAAIARGDNDSMTLQSMVQKYGATVLAAPTNTGFNLVAWVMPFVVFAAAALVAVWLVRMWRSRTLAQPVPRPNLDAAQLDALRKRARQESEF